MRRVIPETENIRVLLGELGNKKSGIFYTDKGKKLLIARMDSKNG